jgi:RND superfamily putative drug exporter
MATYVTNLVQLIGLGIAIDYSLLIVYRFREELARGGSKDDAVVRTMATAGRAVVFSGATVAIGLALLLFMPSPFMRSMGIGGFLIPLVSIAAAVTLQPALLSLYGRRGTKRVRVWRFGEEGSHRGFWERLSAAIMRRPLAFWRQARCCSSRLRSGVCSRADTGLRTGDPAASAGGAGFDVLRDAVGRGRSRRRSHRRHRPRSAARDPPSPRIARLGERCGANPEVASSPAGRAVRDSSGR